MGAAIIACLPVVGSADLVFCRETGIDWDVIFLLFGLEEHRREFDTACAEVGVGVADALGVAIDSVAAATRHPNEHPKYEERISAAS